jgi:hypothetical protein
VQQSSEVDGLDRGHENVTLIRARAYRAAHARRGRPRARAERSSGVGGRAWRRDPGLKDALLTNSSMMEVDCALTPRRRRQLRSA